LKLKNTAPAAAPAPAEPISEPADDAGFGDFGGDENSAPEPAPSDDKPFDDEPFDAGVEADEETDPKKFIEQLTGKLGQSLRKYNEEQGQPDFDLEKFVVNSVLSATHTSEMDEDDKKDIIKKVNTAGNDESNDDGNSSDDNATDNGDNEFGGDDNGGDMGSDDNGGEEDLEEKDGKEVPNCVPVNENHEAMQGGESMNYMFWQNLKTIHHASGELLEMNQQQIDEMCANGHAWAVDHISSSADDIEEVYHFFEGNLNEYDGETEGGYEDEYGSVEDISLNEAEYHGKEVKLGKPSSGDVKKFKVYVKNKKGNVVKVNFGDPNMEIKRDNPERRKSFRARHKCSQAHDRTTPKYWSCKMWSSTPVSKMVAEDLNNSNKNSIFDKNYLKMKIQETFNQDDVAEPMVEPQVAPTPRVAPAPDKVQPIAPSRKNKPFLPTPEVQPDPKARK
jgi:hypothetical protein